MNEISKQDIAGYIKKTLWSAFILISLILIAMVTAQSMRAQLLGAFLGVILATINLFSLGYAFFVIAIKMGSKLIILVPLATFILMCAAAFFLAIYLSSCVFGFALGLTVPIVFGLVNIVIP